MNALSMSEFVHKRSQVHLAAWLHNKPLKDTEANAMRRCRNVQRSQLGVYSAATADCAASHCGRQIGLGRFKL